MKAKERHKIKLLKYLGNWENDFPKRIEMPGILGIQKSTLRKHFSPVELQEIENEGLELRKKHSGRPRAQVYKSMLKEAKGGNISAQREFLDRTEGKLIEKREHTGKIQLSALLDEISGSTRGLPNRNQKKIE